MRAVKCSLCGGRLERGGNGSFDRCVACRNMMVVDRGRVKPLLVVAPGETHDEAIARREETARDARERSLDRLARPKRTLLDRVIALLAVAIVILLGVYAVERMVLK